MISLKDFKLEEITLTNKTKVLGGHIVQTIGQHTSGALSTDAFDDKNGNGQWDSGEPGWVCLS